MYKDLEMDYFEEDEDVDDGSEEDCDDFEVSFNICPQCGKMFYDSNMINICDECLYD